MLIHRTGACPLFIEYVTKQALIPRSAAPTPQFLQLTQFNFRWVDIPSYQRGLVWDSETFEELLNSKSVFLGNAIFGAFSLPSPRTARYIHVPPSANSYEILIDGLQRFSIGTALLAILHALVLADHPLKASEAPHFIPLRAQTMSWTPVVQHNDLELQNHDRNAVRESYTEFRQTLATWIENEFDQGRAADLADKILHLFLHRQIAPDTYFGFASEYDVAKTFIGLNTVRVQLNLVDWLRSVVVDQGSAAGWTASTLAAIDNRFTEVFTTRSGQPEPELMPFVAIVLQSLSGGGVQAKAVFPSWQSGLSEPEVSSFLNFVDEMRRHNDNHYFREIRYCGKIPFAGCLAYYYRLYLGSGQKPTFLTQGGVENPELHDYLRANYRVLLANRIGRTRVFSERLLHSNDTLTQIADQVSDFAISRFLNVAPDPAWLTSALRTTDRNRAPRVFNACLLPPTTSRGGAFLPQSYARSGKVYQVDHMIPESVIDLDPHDPGAAEARTLQNFAPITRQANNSQSNLTCAGKFAPGGSYANEVANDPTVHPYLDWLVANQANHGAFLDQMERLQPLSTPPIAAERITWLADRLSTRL